MITPMQAPMMSRLRKFMGSLARAGGHGYRRYFQNILLPAKLYLGKLPLHFALIYVEGKGDLALRSTGIVDCIHSHYRHKKRDPLIRWCALGNLDGDCSGDAVANFLMFFNNSVNINSFDPVGTELK